MRDLIINHHGTLFKYSTGTRLPKALCYCMIASYQIEQSTTLKGITWKLSCKLSRHHAICTVAGLGHVFCCCTYYVPT